MAFEIAFEYLLAALEATRGTAVDPPTHRLPLMGTITPKEERFYPEQSSGLLAANMTSATVRRWAELKASGGLDSLYAPFLFNMLLKSVTSPTTPGGATTARLWTFTRDMTTDTMKSGTIFWGDPNVQAFRSAFMMLGEATIAADTSGTDGATIELTGRGKFPEKDAPNSTPSQFTGIPIMIPGKMQLWLDTGLAIGSTEITDARLVAASLKFPTGVSFKNNAQGATSDLSFSGVGRGRSAPEGMIRLEVPDTTQYDGYATLSGDTVHKVRVRINGPLIEGALYHYVEWDIYGPLTAPSWGELESTNRTIEFTIPGHYDATLASDLSVKVQNNRTSL